MDPKLKTLRAVYELGSYTEAALECHLTQPAVSQHIKRLETMYQVDLVVFEGRTLTFTKACELLVEHAHLMEAHERELSHKLMKTIQPLRIGMTLSIADYYLPSRLETVLIEEIRNYELVVSNTHHLIQDLKEGRLDCALIEGMFEDDLFDSFEFTEAKFIPVVASNHPLINKTATLKDILKYPIIVREKGSGTRRILENWLIQENKSLSAFESIQEIGSFKALKKMVMRSEGVSFVYEHVVREEIESKGLMPLKLHDFSLKRSLNYVALKHKSKDANIIKIIQCLK